MEMRQIKHALRRDEEAREVPGGTDRNEASAPSSSRRGPLKFITEPCATGLATIKALKNRISAPRGEHVNGPTERGNSNASDNANGAAEATPATEGSEPCLSLMGRSAKGGNGPDAQWKAYSKKYRDEHDRQQSERRIDANGLEAFRFELIEIDRAWWRMKVGDVPAQATQVWEALEIALPVHIIAEDVQISTKECMFWLTVFKRHLDLQEDRQSGRCVYSRDPEQQELSLAVEQKVRALH